MVTIRHATSSDADRIYELIIAIADHHEQSEYVLTTPAQILEAGFGDDPSFGVLLAEYDGSVVGYISYTKNYSIWLGRTYLNIDDVYVAAHCRGLGIGESLMLEIKNYCTGIGISRIRWEVEKDNYDAIRFYEKLGAKYVEKGVFGWDVSN
jgi:ribosomal protein S18 acetylase RimI-like enzyme